jgi:hypothetical protein
MFFAARVKLLKVGRATSKIRKSLAAGGMVQSSGFLTDFFRQMGSRVLT